MSMSMYLHLRNNAGINDAFTHNRDRHTYTHTHHNPNCITHVLMLEGFSIFMKIHSDSYRVCDSDSSPSFIYVILFTEYPTIDSYY